MVPSRRTPRLKTYSRLTVGRRLPSEYEIVSSDLHYHFPQNFELGPTNPVVNWYYQHREGSPLQADNWEAFSDPRRLTYHAYTTLQDDRETVIDGLLREIDDSDYDDGLSEGWVAFLDHWYGPLRFPMHGLEMLAAYVGQMAPASRITNCAAFQAGDELRRLQRVAYRTAQLDTHRFGCDIGQHRHLWEDHELFQPLRQLIELALVAYDWGEAFVALNLVIKPHLDRLVNDYLAGALATANGDPVLQNIHFSLNEDARWHRQWATELVRVALEDTPANASVMSGWVQRWQPRAAAAVVALAGAAELAPVPLDPAAVSSGVLRAASEDVPADVRGGGV
jgi:toluene monooxygenase system protein E